MKDKIDPYLRPLYDSLYDLLDYDKIQRKIESGEIEIAPLSFYERAYFKKFICNS